MPMPVSIEETRLPGVLLVKTGIFHDARGFFAESYSKQQFAAAGFAADFVQDNLSLSAKGTLRGLHYQIHPAPMGKLVRCLRGAIWDVAVDLRRGSPTFAQHVGVELSEGNNLSLWVPVGFAHGFLALSDDVLVLYKCTSHHAPEHERALNYACPQLNIHWPVAPSIISPKDIDAPVLERADYNFGWPGGH